MNMVHVWLAPRITPELVWRAECYCGHEAFGETPAGIIAAMQDHESTEP